MNDQNPGPKSKRQMSLRTGLRRLSIFDRTIMIEINIFIIHGLYLELRCFDPLEAGYCLAAFSFSIPPVLIFEDDACFPAASGV